METAPPCDFVADERTTRTVYSLVYPETRRIVEALWREAPHDMYEAAWTKRQDPLHDDFLDAWEAWVAPSVRVPSDFAYRYPTNGSSEAIRDAIGQHAAEHPGVPIHVLEGEYEGYPAIASGLGVPVVTHGAATYEASIPEAAGRAEPFFLSQPWSGDGCVRRDAGRLLDLLEAHGYEVYLDLCYVGTTTTPVWPADIPIRDNVRTLFFSLSKAFGVYYHRIGGCYSRREMPGLYGNMWFKNLFSLRLGTELMRAHALGELPQRYARHQREIADEMSAASGGAPFEPADVLLLLGREVDGPDPFARFALPEAGARDARWARYCITGHLDARIREAADAR